MKAKKKNNGYILQSRKQFDGEDLLWSDGTPYDSRSAWTWLIQAAAFKDGTYHTQFAIDELKRGEFIASLRFLADAWKWDKNKCARFLALLQKAGRITRQRAGHHGTVYLIANYDTYQDPSGRGGTLRGTANGTISGQSRDKVEESSKEGKSINGDSAYPPEFDFLWRHYPKRPGMNKKTTYACYEARLKQGCAYDVMLEGTKAYNAFCLAQGWTGTNSVKMPETFFGPDRHFTSDWTVTATPQTKKLVTNERALRVWQGMKRTRVLFSSNRDEWQANMARMVEAGEAESIEWLRQLMKAVDRNQLQNAKNDHFAVEHIAAVMPPKLSLAS